MSMWLMYLVIKLDVISKFLGVISIGTFILAAILMFVITMPCEGEPEDIKKLWKFLKPFVLIAIFPLILFLLVPTSREAAAIYFVPKIINNKQVRKMPDKLVTLANSWMDEQIKSIKTGEKDA